MHCDIDFNTWQKQTYLLDIMKNVTNLSQSFLLHQKSMITHTLKARSSRLVETIVMPELCTDFKYMFIWII